MLSVLVGCSWHTISVSGFQSRPEKKVGEAVQLTLSTGERVSMVVQDIRFPHVYGQWRGRVVKVNLNEVVEIRERRNRMAAGLTIAAASVAAFVALFAIASKIGIGDLR
jgi:hypothetical protein